MADKHPDVPPHRHAEPKDKDHNKDDQRGQGSQGGQTNQTAYNAGRDRGNGPRR